MSSNGSKPDLPFEVPSLMHRILSECNFGGLYPSHKKFNPFVLGNSDFFRKNEPFCSWSRHILESIKNKKVKIMKIVKYIISAVVLSMLTVNAIAASSNGPKPRCPIGQIPALQNHIWVCSEPTMKAPGRSGATAKSSSMQLNKKAPTKPKRAKPDLSIVNMMKLNNPNPTIDAFKVYVKNSNAVACPASKMSLSSLSGGGGELSVAPIPANSGKWVTVTFFKFKKGDRILLVIDSKKKVAETNELNNKYAFNW